MATFEQFERFQAERNRDVARRIAQGDRICLLCGDTIKGGADRWKRLYPDFTVEDYCGDCGRKMQAPPEEFGWGKSEPDTPALYVWTHFVGYSEVPE